jgi:cell shape-determining protein MreC
MKILNENLRRETEVCMSREKENITLEHENKTLKDMIGEYKSQS